MRILIDSNRFIDFCAGVPEVVEVFEQAALLVVPFIVLAEIRVGAESIKRGDAQVRILAELLQQPGVRVAHSSDTMQKIMKTCISSDSTFLLRTSPP